MSEDPLENARSRAKRLHANVATTMCAAEPTMRANAQMHALDIIEFGAYLHQLLDHSEGEIGRYVGLALASLDDAARDAAAVAWASSGYTKIAAAALLARLNRVSTNLSHAIAVRRSLAFTK